jgi:hypothetical protein
MLPCSLLYNSAEDFAILNVMCSHVWIITVPAIYIYIYIYIYTHTHTHKLLLCLQDTFILCVIELFFILPTVLY